MLCLPGAVAGPQGQEAHYLGVPIVAQEKDFCGAASLAMVFQYWGRPISQYAIVAAIDHAPGRGLKGEDLRAYSEANGFTAITFRGDLAAAKEHLRKGRPLIVAVRSKAAGIYHYIVLVGFDDRSSVVLVNDPQRGKLKKVKSAKFLRDWDRSRFWSLLIVPK